MVSRHITPALLAALRDTPVVLLNGARQTGKSTLARWVADEVLGADYLTLDDLSVLSAARADPVAFVGGFARPVVLDEVQRAPELFPAIKAHVDRKRKPGQFLLTGSANVLLLPQLATYLVGRMEIVTLWPFAQGEIEGTTANLVDALFSRGAELPQGTGEDRRSIFHRVLCGGYPEVVSRRAADRRRAWFDAYTTTLLQRDVRDLANIEGLTALPRLLSLLATRAGGLLNTSELSRSTGIPTTTLQRYLTLLQATYLVHLLPAWSSNLGKRLTKSPKLLLTDTGLMAHLLGMEEPLPAGGPHAGPLLEVFVAAELLRQASWSKARPAIHHFRTASGQEVDLVLENRAGQIVGVEVKAATSATASDFSGLRVLAELAGERFLGGVVLYTGTDALPFGPNLRALPVSALWGS